MGRAPRGQIRLNRRRIVEQSFLESRFEKGSKMPFVAPPNLCLLHDSSLGGKEMGREREIERR